MKTTSEGYTSSVMQTTHTEDKGEIRKQKIWIFFYTIQSTLDFLPGETLFEFSELVTDHEGG